MELVDNTDTGESTEGTEEQMTLGEALRACIVSLYHVSNMLVEILQVAEDTQAADQAGEEN